MTGIGIIAGFQCREGVTPHGELILRTAARVCKRTGTPISTHHWAPLQVGRRQAEIFLEEDTPMNCVCIGHIADTVDADYIEDWPREHPTRYLFLSTTAIPALLADGVPQATIDEMMRTVPREFLSGETE